MELKEEENTTNWKNNLKSQKVVHYADLQKQRRSSGVKNRH